MHVNTVLPAVAAYFTLQKNRGRSQGPWTFPLTDRTRLPISLSGSGFVSCSHGQLQERTKESYTTTTGTFIMSLTSHLRQAIGFLRILEQVTSRHITCQEEICTIEAARKCNSWNTVKANTTG